MQYYGAIFVTYPSTNLGSDIHSKAFTPEDSKRLLYKSK